MCVARLFIAESGRGGNEVLGCRVDACERGGKRGGLRGRIGATHDFEVRVNEFSVVFCGFLKMRELFLPEVC